MCDAKSLAEKDRPYTFGDVLYE